MNNEKNFLDLNAENVKKIYEDCQINENTQEYYEISLEQTDFGYSQNSKPLYFDANLLNSNIPNIYFLFGQLKSSHEPTYFLPIKDILKKYDGTSWSNQKVSPIYLLHLGIAAGAITPPNLKLKSCILAEDLIPTFSPNDPQFEEWYKDYKQKMLRKKGGQEPADD